MYDLIYAGCEAKRRVRERFPTAVIEDASDMIHEERFSVELPDAMKSEYQAFVRSGDLAPLSLGVQLESLNPLAAGTPTEDRENG